MIFGYETTVITCIKGKKPIKTERNKRFQLLWIRKGILWLREILMEVPIWKDSWQSVALISTISNCGIFNPLCIIIGAAFFHSSRNSSIVFETEMQIYLLVGRGKKISILNFHYSHDAISIVQIWLSNGNLARSIIHENLNLSLK